MCHDTNELDVATGHDDSSASRFAPPFSSYPLAGTFEIDRTGTWFVGVCPLDSSYWPDNCI